MSTPLAVPALRSSRFRQERQSQWDELEDILRRYERSGTRRLSDEDLIALPKLYRATLSGLSVARATSLDQSVIAYLESLSARAYYAIYGTPGRLFPRLVGFFTRDWPAAVRKLWPETLVAGATMFIGALVAFLLVMNDPEWFYKFVPEALASGRDPAASTATLRDSLYGQEDMEGMGFFASSLFAHNSGVSIFAFALGFAAGVPTLMLMFFNGAVLGAFYAVHVEKGLGVELGGWLSIHGTTEILAIILAGAAGLHIGRAAAFPGTRSRMAAASEHGGRAGIVMFGVVVMLFLAGLIEGFLRQKINSDLIRYSFGWGLFALWMFYFYARRQEVDA